METKKSEFKAFDRVLVRNENYGRWQSALYDQYLSYKGDYPHHVIGDVSYAQCIPYEGNEHLLGTTDKYVPKPLKPKLEETFFAVFHKYGEPFYVSELTWECLDKDERMYLLGNCFQTREEAEAMADKFNALLNGKE